MNLDLSLRLNSRAVLQGASTPLVSMPAGALAIWDASTGYVASPRAMVKNSATNGATDANLLAAPRRMFNKNNSTIFFWGGYGGPTFTDDASVAPDGTNEASTIVGSSVTGWGLAYATVPLPAGTYTIACSVKSLGGADSIQLTIAGAQNLSSGDLPVTTSWSRKTFTFTQPSTGNEDFRITAPSAGSNPNLAICDYQVFAGSADLNTTWATLAPLSVRNGDAVLGNSQFAGNTALVAGMVPDAILSHVQLLAAQTPSDFTVLYCTKPTATGAGASVTGILGITGNDWYRFVSGYNIDGGGVSGGPQYFGNGTNIGCNANGNITSASSWGLLGQGIITGVSRKNGTRTSTFINGLKLQDGVPSIPSAFAMKNLTLGGIRTVNQNLPSGHSWGCIAYYPRALSDAEVKQALAYFKAKFGDVGMKRLLGLEGTSITQILPTYQSYVGPNLNPQRLLTSQAVASATVALANANHVGPLDATISAGPPQDSYVLSNELGTNDLAAGRTAAQLLSDLQAYTTARRAAGWQKFIMFTVLPRNPAGTSISEAAFNSARATHNANLRAGVGVWFDALVDQAANSTIGVDGAWSNATNFPDGTHPSPNVHQTIIEPLFRTAVNSLP